MRSPFLEYWSERRERGEVLDRHKELKLNNAQLSSLIGDSDVRAALQKSRIPSLLPPVGTEVFRRFTPESLGQIKKCMDSKNKQVEEDCRLKPAPELECGNVLPFFYGAPPPELQDVPLEDPDPFYQSQKTFVVVSKGNVLSRFNADSSCFHFSPFSLFRRASIKILNHKLFTIILLVALLVNLLFMFPHWTWEFIIDLVLLCIYTLEAVMKILSRGFCLGPFTYLRDSWNRLDMFIIITGFLFFNVPELWFLKPLRCLKILGLFAGTRRHAKTFGRVLIGLLDVLFLTLLVLTVFSLMGMDLFTGVLRNTCVRNWEQTNSSLLLNSTDSQNGTENSFNYMEYIQNKDNYYFMENCAEPQICRNSSMSSMCPDGFTCLQVSNFRDMRNFDSFADAFLSTFRLMMRDYWEALAGEVMQGTGEHTIVFFVVTIFICSFSLTAFIIASFFITFTKQTDREVQQAKQDEKDYNKILAVLKEKGVDELPEKKDSERTCSSCWRLLCSCDCCDFWVRIKKGLQVFVLDPFFDLAIILLIILNVIFMSMEHYPLTEKFHSMLSLSHFVFTIIFLIEVVLKILALGPYVYFQVGWHIFETILVILSLFSLAIADVAYMVIVELMVLRLFRLARWWPGFLKWMRLVWIGLRSLWTLSLVVIVVFFTLFGNRFFTPDYGKNLCRLTEDCTITRWHTSDWLHAFMLVIRALCGEWIETMWDCVTVSTGFGCVLFYITLLIVGNFLILILFVTLLMKWISNKLAPKDEEKMQTLKTRIKKVFRVCGRFAEETKKETGNPEDKESMALRCAPSEQTEENGTQSNTLPIGEAQNFQKMKETENPQDAPEDCCCEKCYSCCPALNLDTSRGFGRVWFNLRRSSFNIIQHPYFNNFIFFIIIVSSIALVWEDMYLPTRSTLMVFLGYLDQVITYLFVLEVLFKWLGLGFKKYFTDGWCWLDLIVTLACVLSVVAQTSALGSVLISLKALRPLRILAHIKGTRVSVSALLRMLPSLLDALLVTATVWQFFSIVFVQFFAGKFEGCFNETCNIFPADVVPNKTECFVLIENNYTEVRWKKEPWNFDNTPQATLSLFSVGTLKGWLEILYNAVDSTYVESQPDYEANISSYFLFLAFFLFGCFFCCIYIIKMLLDAYSSQTHKVGGSHLFLTEEQQKNFNNISFCPKRPLAPCPRPQGRLRGRLFDLVSREGFEWVMQVFIFVGVVLMMVERYDITEEEERIIFWITFTLTLIFTIESFLKICAFRRSYFSDSLNVIDFVVVIYSIIDMFLADILLKYFFGGSLHLLRLARISRIIHRFPAALRVRFLFSAWTKSLRALFNLALVLFVLMFTYASFGTFHFAHLKKTNYMSDVYNFETFGNGLICMFMATTWAGWDGLIKPSLLTPPDCEPVDIPQENITANCGNASLAVVFYVSFLCLSCYVVLLMLLVLLVDMLNIFGRMHYDPLSAPNLNRFFKTWKKFVPDSAHFIQRSQLPDFCDKLKKPLRVPTLSNLDLSPEDPVSCRDVLLALSVQALGDSADRDALRARINGKYHEYMPNNSPQESCEETSCTLQMNQEEATPMTEEIAE
ncbi:sodium channel protein type 4 subunit alpha B-like [Periophthalmus magnuspinnatus]|uniref:sodium channel protein type 4 subunit alpha B-like n=1 Tax=Periophthalmus magnuspinnatus TaxID=409849 RepID=UPI002436F6FB|nr:sodium channel protein type 4 subunit alpha B-like [Periophthalmus magnuspinnatus]